MTGPLGRRVGQRLTPTGRGCTAQPWPDCAAPKRTTLPV